jgi:hypothetical protein
VENGALSFYLDVPNCSPGWVNSWSGQQFAISFVPPGDFQERVTQTYLWPANVCG